MAPSRGKAGGRPTSGMGRRKCAAPWPPFRARRAWRSACPLARDQCLPSRGGKKRGGDRVVGETPANERDHERLICLALRGVGGAIGTRYPFTPGDGEHTLREKARRLRPCRRPVAVKGEGRRESPRFARRAVPPEAAVRTTPAHTRHRARSRVRVRGRQGDSCRTRGWWYRGCAAPGSPPPPQSHIARRGRSAARGLPPPRGQSGPRRRQNSCVRPGDVSSTSVGWGSFLPRG